MRLAGTLAPERFDALLDHYQRLLRDVFRAAGGREVEAEGDTVTAVFAAPKLGAQAAAAVLRAVAQHDWPDGLNVAVSIALDSVQALRGRGAVTERLSELCDAAEGGQIFASASAAALLAGEDLGGLVLRDRGEQRTRRTQRAVHAHELVIP